MIFELDWETGRYEQDQQIKYSGIPFMGRLPYAFIFARKGLCVEQSKILMFVRPSDRPTVRPSDRPTVTLIGSAPDLVARI